MYGGRPIRQLNPQSISVLACLSSQTDVIFKKELESFGKNYPILTNNIKKINSDSLS